MKKILVLMLVAILVGVGWGYGRFRLEKERVKRETNVYVVAHPDDDLLFMNPSIKNDLEIGRKVVVIYVTAGDAGQDENYWQSRFRGIEAAYGVLVGVKRWQKKEIEVGGKKFEERIGDGERLRLVLMKIVDGNYRGEGFEKTGYQSLQKLWFGEIEKIRTVDGQTYTKKELVGVLARLIENFEPKVVNTQDFVGSYGEGDHSDHLSVARLAKEADCKMGGKWDLRSYADYEISGWEENLRSEERKLKERAFLAYSQYDPWSRDSDWQKWVGREYVKWEGRWRGCGIGRKIRVEGDNLVDGEGKRVRLMGVATKVFRWKRNGGNIEEFWRRWEVMRSYGANLVMAYIYPDTFAEFAPEIDELVKRADEEGFEVALVPVEDDIDFRDVEGRINSAMRFPEFMGRVAERYKDKTNVIYGIWTEPANMSEREYADYIRAGVEAIRKQVKDAVVIVDGLNCGRRIGGLADFKKMGNIVLDFHDYPAADEIGLSRFLKGWKGEFIWEKYVGKGLPVMVGEFGGMWRDGFGSRLDLWWIERELERIDQKGVSYVMYTMDNEGGLSLFKPGGVELSEKGKLFREFLMKENLR